MPSLLSVMEVLSEVSFVGSWAVPTNAVEPSELVSGFWNSSTVCSVNVDGTPETASLAPLPAATYVSPMAATFGSTSHVYGDSLFGLTSSVPRRNTRISSGFAQTSLNVTFATESCAAAYTGSQFDEPSHSCSVSVA